MLVLNRKTIITLVLVGAAEVALMATLILPRFTQARAPVSPPAHDGTGPAGTAPLAVQEGLDAVVAAVRPAVVQISAHPDAVGHPVQPGMQFLDPFPDRNGWVGSGVIVDPSGYILTSRQVVGDAQVVRVTLFRGGENSFLARRVATDPGTDLVLLQLPFGGSLPHALLGDSSRVRTGNIVIAMGSPFGLSETVTQGIVSAHRQTLYVEGRRFDDVIQTDASINKGNSGGPLIDIRAEVIGVNIAVYSTDSTFSGVGFAIASNRARAFLEHAVGR